VTTLPVPAPPSPPADPSARAEPQLRVAPAARRRRARRAVWSSALTLALALFVLVAFHVVAVQNAFELDQLAEQREAEASRYERLRTEFATLSSPAAIVEAARRMGMVPSGEIEYIEAPAAAPRGQSTDANASTLADAHGESKSSLGP
jgi:cell division protein FtsB